MRFLMTGSDTGWKVLSGMPSNGFVRGRELVHTGTSEFEDFVTKKGREQSWEIR